MDNVPPQFTAIPANIVVTNDPGLPSAVVNYPASVAKDVGFNEGFEDPAFVSGNYANSPSVDWNDYNGHLYRVPSGTDGIISRTGVAHAVIDPTVATPDANGVFSRLGGYSSVFGSGFRVAQDIYMDLNNPGVVNATATNGYAWDLSSAANGQNNQYQCEFIFHTAAYDSTGIVVVGDNSGSSDDARYRRNDLLTVPNHAVLTNSGWYTFEWIYRNNANTLAVDMNVRDAAARCFTPRQFPRAMPLTPSWAAIVICGSPSWRWTSWPLTTRCWNATCRSLAAFPPAPSFRWASIR